MFTSFSIMSSKLGIRGWSYRTGSEFPYILLRFATFVLYSLTHIVASRISYLLGAHLFVLHTRYFPSFFLYIRFFSSPCRRYTLPV